MIDDYSSSTREWIMFAEMPNARTKIIFAPVSSGPVRKKIKINNPLFLYNDFLTFLRNILICSCGILPPTWEVIFTWNICQSFLHAGPRNAHGKNVSGNCTSRIAVRDLWHISQDTISSTSWSSRNVMDFLLRQQQTSPESPSVQAELAQTQSDLLLSEGHRDLFVCSLTVWHRVR